jgi:hypothetical protein
MNSILQIPGIITQTKHLTTFLFAVVMVWFFLPVLSVAGLLVLLMVADIPLRVQNFFLFLIALSFGLVAYTTQSVGTEETDIGRYYFSYDFVSNIDSFSDLFLLFFVADGTSILFQLITLAMAKIFPANFQLLPLFWVTVTYFFSFLAIKECVYFLSGYYSKVYVVVVFFAMAGIVTFFTATEIIKQVSSAAIFAYALMLHINKKKGAAFWVVISILVHLSSLFLMPIYWFSRKQSIIKHLPWIFLICLGVSFINFNTIMGLLFAGVVGDSGLGNRLQAYEEVDTWTISFRFFMIFGIYLFQLALVAIDLYHEKDMDMKQKKRIMVIVQVLAFLFLLVNRSNVHNFIRYTFGFFPFYALIFLQLFYARFKKAELTILVWLVGSFYIFSNVRLLQAQTVIGGPYDNSYMNNNVKDIMVSNVYDFLDFDVKLN